MTHSLRALACAALIASPAPALAQAEAPIPKEHASMVEEMGGLYTGPMLSYVATVGRNVATAAGRRDCAFHVVDTDVVNAFTAPPGCHVYITRGLLGLINSEDELAGVLGHEVGHVTANHAGRREQSAQMANIGAAILGAVTKSNVVGSLAGQVAQLGVLSYSRNQEFESDQLAVRYTQGAGYSPYAMTDVLAALEGQDRLMQTLNGGKAEKATPSWARTHPLNAERITRATKAALATGQPQDAVAEKHDEYLARTAGLTWGDSPRQGFVDGRKFVHPDLGIAFEAPEGYTITNTPKAVNIEGPGGKAQFSMAAMRGDVAAQAGEVLKAVVGQSPVQAGQVQRRDINGLAAAVLPAQAQAQNGVVDLTVATYDAGSGRAYHFVTITPPGGAQAFAPLISSFRKIDAKEAAAAQGRSIQVVTVGPKDTTATLAARMAVPQAQEQAFRLINGLESDDTLAPGQKVKLISLASTVQAANQAAATPVAKPVAKPTAKPTARAAAKPAAKSPAKTALKPSSTR